MVDRIVFWVLLLIVGPFLIWHSTYEAGKASAPAVTQYHYLTGTVDPLLCAKGKRA